MAKPKAVVLCSGGLNSAVLSMMARQEHIIALLHARFKHRSDEKEAALFEKQVEFLEPQQHLTIEMPHYVTIGGNARVSRKYNMEDARAIGEGRSTCHVPGLISGLLSAAFTWANVIGAGKIMIGVSEDLGPPAPRTASIYPDYSREHLEMCRHAITAASMQKTIAVEMPLIDLRRAEIISLGHRLGAPFNLTWSCLASNDAPCGACIGCATRARGFVDAGIPDPILTKEPAMAR
ncbi:MAG: 7-cyano-7-deazaguanine synthase [Phycisphaerae bacterium]|nr:7-cyano-7-deazaguanine synthase [Phycisphaerae bacterium]